MPKLLDHYDGELGELLLRLSVEAADACSRPGPADENVEHYRDNSKHVRWIADANVLRRSLKRYGAWEDLENVSLDTLRNRVLWLAAGDWRENHGKE